MAKTWIVYKTEVTGTPGWEERLLMPRGSLTEILWETWTNVKEPKLPKVGDRTRDYRSNEAGFTTDAKDGDWVVIRTEIFSSSESDTQIVMAYCQFDPIAENWGKIERGKSIKEILEVGSNSGQLLEAIEN
jgi:hypothetical protein